MQNESILRKEDTLFLIIDIQERLLPAVSESEEVEKYSTILAQAAKILNIPLIISEQYPKGLGSTISSILEAMPENTKVIEKYSFSCMKNDELARELKASRASQVVISGIESHICVAQTALDLASIGIQVQILQDGVSSRNPANKSNALSRMSRAGITISNTESALFELLGYAKGDKFKAISKLIK